MDRSRGNSDRNDWGNCLSDGRYHRFLISDRISLCTNDRCTDRRFLYPSSGFLAYRWLMGVDTILGNTLPDMVITIILSVIVSLLFGKKND